MDEGWTVKVADFGLAKAMETVATLTGGLGTYQWMAPEVLARQHYSQKADVYSFGVVLWETCARQVRPSFSHAFPGQACMMYTASSPMQV